MGYPWQTLFALAILSFISVATFQLFPFWPNSLADLQADPLSRVIPAPGCTLSPLFPQETWL